MSNSLDDEDSVAEELEESLEESLEEDYSDDNYSEDNYSVSASAPAVQTSAINLDDLVISPVPLARNKNGSRALQNKSKDESKLSNMSADQDGDNYSLSFDDDSENNSIYSQDFDISAMSMSRNSPAKQTQTRSGAPPVAPRQQTVSFQQQQQQQPPPPPQQEIPAHVLPSLAIQSLAAENAMEKLSKEIVYLRNQQRIALKDRRLEALAKKKRAEERRQQHKQDLFGARQEVATLQVEKETLEEKVRVLELTVLGAEESKALMSEALKANQVGLGEQQQAMEQMRTEISSGAELLSRREAEWTVKEADLAAKMEAMRAALVKAELHVSVMAKSNEAAEERSVHCSAEDTMLRVQAIISHQLNVNSYCYLCSALVCDCC